MAITNVMFSINAADLNWMILISLPAFAPIVCVAFERLINSSYQPVVKSLSYLGKISYSTYLCHYLIIKLFSHFHGPAETALSIIFALVILPIVIVSVSALSYQSLERLPINLAHSWKLRQRPARR